MSKFEAVLPGLGAADHRPHALHGADRIWVEKNCYVDLWIELLHAQDFDPHACLPFVFALDFEGDHWTFFKPPLADLRALYGIDVQELTVWRPLLDHAREHLGAGKWLAAEVDAFWLPDTAGTDYRQSHTKTTIVLNAIDGDARRLGYFHNAGYFELGGEDFAQLFAIDAPTALLPPYAELIRLDRCVARSQGELRTLSARLLTDHLAWRPRSNPVARFRERFEADLPVLQQAGLAHYHRWAFAGVRQLGAAFELAAIYLRWLRPEAPPQPAIDAFERIAQHSKTLILKAARAVNSGRALEARPMLDEMADDWARGMAELGDCQ
ncbi:MAG: DUF1839 family protein [Rhizobiales bacterium]|nr:DUF1839 family protein [Rhizobacter sp.]